THFFGGGVALASLALNPRPKTWTKKAAHSLAPLVRSPYNNYLPPTAPPPPQASPTASLHPLRSLRSSLARRSALGAHYRSHTSASARRRNRTATANGPPPQPNPRPPQPPNQPSRTGSSVSRNSISTRSPTAKSWSGQTSFAPKSAP